MWVECDRCKWQMHSRCMPEFHKDAVQFDSDQSADEIDFICEFCYKNWIFVINLADVRYVKSIAYFSLSFSFRILCHE